MHERGNSQAGWSVSRTILKPGIWKPQIVSWIWNSYHDYNKEYYLPSAVRQCKSVEVHRRFGVLSAFIFQVEK
jgi:hypothetical protein